MRIDVVTIFPSYLEPLQLSMVGRAMRVGALNLAVHDLRDWTVDVHRTVDDTPYGGGAGMLMRPNRGGLLWTPCWAPQPSTRPSVPG